MKHMTHRRFYCEGLDTPQERFYVKDFWPEGLTVVDTTSSEYEEMVKIKSQPWREISKIEYVAEQELEERLSQLSAFGWNWILLIILGPITFVVASTISAALFGGAS
jgi:hypothetical protein